MVEFIAALQKLGEMGEKTGWTIVELPVDISEQLNPGVKKSYRVKGFLDKHAIAGAALIPMGGGIFILPVNAAMRKGIAKKEGAMLRIKLALDNVPYEQNALLIECLQESPKANKIFQEMPRSHQNYYSKWVDAAKTEATKEKRIITIITGLERGLTYAEMLREQSALRK